APDQPPQTGPCFIFLSRSTPIQTAAWSSREKLRRHLRVDAFGYEDVTVAVAALGSRLMWANILRPFQVGKARTSHDGPSSWMRQSRDASVQVSWPACHLTKASAPAVMYRS